ncbi:MAG: hypothetical protein R3E84_10675 [Pseudomonadales bacterium]
MNTATPQPYWFVRLDRRWPFGRISYGIAVFVFMSVLTGAPLGVLNPGSNLDAIRGSLGPVLFFAFVNAVVLAGIPAILDRSRRALEQLAPCLDIDSATLTAMSASLITQSRFRAVTTTATALAVGCAHYLLIIDPGLGEPDIGVTRAQSLGGLLGTVITWFVILGTITALIYNARLYGAIGRKHLQADALQPHQLAPFATLALLPSLTLMGTQMAYPLLSLSGEFNANATMPGFLLTLGSAIYLLLRPTWPVHVHMREARDALLASTNARLAEWRRGQSPMNLPASNIAEVSALLTFRDHVRRATVWPFNIALIGRWLFYLIIPPLTWVLAALVEYGVDHWLG